MHFLKITHQFKVRQIKFEVVSKQQFHTFYY